MTQLCKTTAATVKAGKLQSLFIPSAWFYLPAAAIISSQILSDQDGDMHRACTDDVLSTKYPLSVEMPSCCCCRTLTD